MLYIIKNKENLKTQRISYKVTRFFVRGYRKSKYFWEFIQILRKFLIVLVFAFFRNQQSLMVFSILPLVATFLFIHIYNKPYDDQHFNNLETFSLGICFMSYYLMVYITFAQTENIQISLFIFMIFCNLVFLVFWGKYYLKVLKKQAKDAISNLSSKIHNFTSFLHRKNNSLQKKTNRKYLRDFQQLNWESKNTSSISSRKIQSSG